MLAPSRLLGAVAYRSPEARSGIVPVVVDEPSLRAYQSEPTMSRNAKVPASPERDGSTRGGCVTVAIAANDFSPALRDGRALFRLQFVGIRFVVLVVGKILA